MVLVGGEKPDRQLVRCESPLPSLRRKERRYSGQNEDAIKAHLSEVLPRWFRVAREVRGTHPTEGRVRIDFCCFPNDEMVRRGFEEVVFGIEVKHAPSDQMTAMNVARQAHIYTEATYRVGIGRQFGLEFVCVCPSFVRMVEGYPPCLPDHIARVMAKLKVGELVLFEDVWAEPSEEEFAIYFSHQHRYFDSLNGAAGNNPRLRARGVSR